MHSRFVRLYSDPSGESHFEDVETELSLADFAPPAPPLELSEYLPAARTAFLGGPAGWTGDWHVSAGRNFFVVLSGEWEIETSDGATRLFSPGSVLLVEDTSGKGHRSRVVSKGDSLAVLVELAD
jgi:hypothetical protein